MVDEPNLEARRVYFVPEVLTIDFRSLETLNCRS
jgi:hypothetical protein